MKINLEGVRYYCGLGDIVLLAWLAEGSKRGPDPLAFHRTRDLDLMTLLGLAVDPEPGGVCLDEVFHRECADRCREPRVNYIRRFLNLTTPLARPALHVPAADEEWADGQFRELGTPLVLLFPQTAWKTREWPASYWVDLAWKLKAAGVPTVVLMANKDERFTNTPLYWWGTPIPRLAALMKRAALVVGNDSFPAHLAGAVGVPTLALMGPTRPTVYAHAPAVECVTTAALDCVGCHFRAPFRAACDQGCMALYRLFPDDVLALALGKTRSVPPAVAGGAETPGGG